jgi:2-C-methyl-D-erythritol 4-phosphate cytidylyltransferase
VKPVDTIRANEGGFAGRTVDRDGLVRVQTPQCFERELIVRALERAETAERYFTDDAGAVMETEGVTPRIVEGERENVKITTELDAELVELLLGDRS